jgi:2-hydroxy-3-keto-5-methylthiopentenyl-1-phosphate phosphatase
MENNKAEHFSGENEEIDASECNKKINKYIRFPTLTWEKIIKLIIVTGGTGFMIVTFFTGLGYSRHDIDCYDDMPYYYTESIHNYFYEHEGFCLALKFIISFLIDLLIIYTLIVWSLFGTNVRLISSGCTFFIVNLLCRFLHIQIQPENRPSLEVTFFPFLLITKLVHIHFFLLH